MTIISFDLKKYCDMIVTLNGGTYGKTKQNKICERNTEKLF